MLQRKVLLPALILSFLLSSGRLVREPKDFTHQDVNIVGRQFDSRAKVLKNYFAKFNSPLENQAQDFVDAADTYNMDWRLVAAISGVESTFGKFIPGGFNAWGWGVYGDQSLYFKSWTEGIYTVSEGLKTHYLDKGLTDPYAINRIYAESPYWGRRVSYFLEDIEKFNQYQSGREVEISPNLSFGIAGASASLIPN